MDSYEAVIAQYKETELAYILSVIYLINGHRELGAGFVIHVDKTFTHIAYSLIAIVNLWTQTAYL
jgi:hypothetical protein